MYKEGFLIQVIFYSIIWFISEYIGLLLCVVMTGVIGALLIFALILELVDKSEVPASYFCWMGLSCIAPLVVGLGFSFLYGGVFEWM